jgi:PKD repeat protein
MGVDSFGSMNKTHRNGAVSVSLRDFVRALQTLPVFLLLATPLTASAVNVLTQHNDSFRTGASLSESTLAVSNVSTGQFGKLFSCKLDGQIYAQPLYVGGLMISNNVHNVVYIETEHDSVYAFDADDPAASNALWQVSLGTPVPIADIQGCTDLKPEIGITGTPVIDLTSSTMYLVAKTRMVSGSVTNHFQQLHALDLVTGQEKFGGPVSIQGSVPGTGTGSVGGTLTFDPLFQHSRAGLLLLSNTVYVAFGSHCDYGNYHGWLFGYDATSLQQTAIFCTTPNAGGGPDDGGGGIWGSGSGPVADTDGNIYVTTGNGALDKNTGGIDYGDSLLKLSVSNGTLVVADWFSPHDQANMYTNDLDLGAGGPIMIPSANLLVTIGKTGTMYLIDRNHLGGFVSSSSDTNIVQEFSAVTNPSFIGQSLVYWSGPTNDFIFLWTHKMPVKAYSFDGASIATSPVAVGSTVQNADRVGGISLSANGNTPGSGILWGTEAGSGGTLHAYDATNVAHELWNSQQMASRDALGSYTKFCAPTIANGKVYVATTSSNLVVYGLLATPSQGVSPASYDFGALATGTTAQTSFVVTNTGGGTLTGTVVTAGPFAIVSGGSYSAVGGGSTNVVISFTPQSPGSFSNSVVFTSNGGVLTNLVTGTGLTPPYLSVSPGTLNYGSLVIGQTSNQLFSVINTGQVTLTGTTAVGLPFAAASNASYTVAGGATGLVLISFSPSAAGAVAGNLVFTSTGGVSTNAVTGTGLMPANLSVNPGSVNFSTIATGTTAQATFVVTNSGGGPLNGTAVVGGAPFAIASGSPFNIAGFGSANVVISFTPASAGSFPDQVIFASNGGGATNAVTGTGAIVPVPGFNGSPTAGLVPLAVTFTDTSTGTITNRFWTFGDGGTTNTLNTTVSYTYNGTGVFTATLSDFGPVGGTQTSTRMNYIVVTNIPSQLAVTPAIRNYGALPVGQASTQSFSVVNSGLSLLSGTATAGGSPFSIIGGTPYNLSGGQTGTVNVAFNPVAVGNFTNSMVFASNGGNSTNVVIGSGAIVPSAGFSGTPTTGIVSLAVNFTDSSTGTITNRAWTFGDGGTTNTLNTTMAHTYNSAGADTVTLVVTGPLGLSTNTRANYIVVTNGPPHLVVTPGNRDFGLLPVSHSSTQTFSLANAGLQTLTGTATISGTPFALVSGSPYTVSSAHTGLVSVSFSPAATGAFTGSVVFASNGGFSTNALTGSAAVAPTAVFTGTPTNGAATLVVNFTDASSGTITGRVWVFGDGSTSAATSPSHAYTNAGIFSVGLTVSGPLGSNMLLHANYIRVTNVTSVVPMAAFTANPTSGAAPLLVNFTDASTGVITNRLWTFGDGNTSATTSPSHTYSNAGAYSVSLKVLGRGGSGLTNLVNLIKVTNVVSTAPTVTIVRPANGMLYPPVTNLTITIVASATANDGAAISKIEFFADGAKLGETTSNPGTNLLINPALGSHVILGRATDALGATNSSRTTTITIGAKNSPLGDWEVTIGGADKGAQFLTFQDDFTANSYGIRLKTFGPDEVSGQWGFNSKGQVTGPFIEQTDGNTNWTGMLSGSARSLKSLNGTAATTVGAFHWKGIPTTTFPDLSGTWTGLVTAVRTTPVAVSYVFSANTNDSAVFEIATSDTPGTVVGQLLVTSRNKVYGYLTFSGKPVTMSGNFRAARLSLTLNGMDATADKISIKIFKQ